MRKNTPNAGARKPTRHPAVIDTLGPTPKGTTLLDRRGALTSPRGVPDANTPDQPRRTSTPDRSGQRRIRTTTAIGAVVAVAAVAGAVSWAALAADEAETSTPGAPSTTQKSEVVTPTPVVNSDPAESLSAAPRSKANQCHSDRGDQKTAAGVIAAFEHAYYVLRSGEAARALTTPGSPLPTADKIQAGIDTVPLGTSYCLRAIETTNDHYTVVLTETRPGEPATQFTQTITTTHIDGRWLIDLIA